MQNTPSQDDPPPDVQETFLVNKRDWSVWLATGLGVGFFPVAPGTVGTLWGIPLAWGMSFLPVWGEVLVILSLIGGGIPLCTRAVRKLGGKKDPGSVVWDEITSLPITYFLVSWDRPSLIVAGFLLHRLFDISKPPPARQLEKLPDGLGVMADDWIAGLYSMLVLQGLLWGGFFDFLGI